MMDNDQIENNHSYICVALKYSITCSFLVNRENM